METTKIPPASESEAKLRALGYKTNDRRGMLNHDAWETWQANKNSAQQLYAEGFPKPKPWYRRLWYRIFGVGL